MAKNIINWMPWQPQGALTLHVVSHRYTHTQLHCVGLPAYPTIPLLLLLLLLLLEVTWYMFMAVASMSNSVCCYFNFFILCVCVFFSPLFFSFCMCSLCLVVCVWVSMFHAALWQSANHNGAKSESKAALWTAQPLPTAKVAIVWTG